MKENKEKEVITKEKGVNNMNKGVDNMNKLVKEIEAKKEMLVKKVVEWAKSLNPIKDIHIKVRGRYYPLLGKDGKLHVIDKVQGKKIPFDTLDDNSLKFVIASILAERKEEIEKEVEEEKRKHLEKKAAEIDKLLLKF
jgi:hypothetical protein